MEGKNAIISSLLHDLFSTVHKLSKEIIFKLNNLKPYFFLPNIFSLGFEKEH